MSIAREAEAWSLFETLSEMWGLWAYTISFTFSDSFFPTFTDYPNIKKTIPQTKTKLSYNSCLRSLSRKGKQLFLDISFTAQLQGLFTPNGYKKSMYVNTRTYVNTFFSVIVMYGNTLSYGKLAWLRSNLKKRVEFIIKWKLPIYQWRFN